MNTTKDADRAPVHDVVSTPVVYFVQSRDKRFNRNHWSQWNICSPHMERCDEARKAFESKLFSEHWEEQFRLVRCYWTVRRLPLKKTILFATEETHLKVLSIRSC